MDNFFSDDEYQLLRTFERRQVETEVIERILVKALDDMTLEKREVMNVTLLNTTGEVQTVSKILIPETVVVQTVLMLSVRSYRNSAGKEFPVTWYAEAEFRQSILLALEANGLDAFYRAVFPNLHLVSKLRHMVMIPEEFLPMSCIFLGYPDNSTMGTLERFQTKVKRDEGSADYWSAGL